MTVEELPNIEGSFGCSVPANHIKFANGVFSSTNFGDTKGDTVSGPNHTGMVYGFHINFGNNQYHNNIAPCVSAYIWRRTA